MCKHDTRPLGVSANGTLAPSTNNEEETQAPHRPYSPFHVTFSAEARLCFLTSIPCRHPAHEPRYLRIPYAQAMTHVAWSCDDHISWNPTHPELFCTSSQKDRRIVFWDARPKDINASEFSRHVQQLQLKVSLVQKNYAPDGGSLLYTFAGHQFFLTYRKDDESSKDMDIWQISDKDGNVRVLSTVMFNHVGDEIILTHHSTHSLRITDYPSLTLRENISHPAGTTLVNALNLNQWICSRTIASCENTIDALSFSLDGEYLAITSTGSYIDIVLHDGNDYPNMFFAYFGQTKQGEANTPLIAVNSSFGGGI
ncbi:hypothetical protein V8E55_001473 [Tylopilus felleus]